MSITYKFPRSIALQANRDLLLAATVLDALLYKKETGDDRDYSTPGGQPGVVTNAWDDEGNYPTQGIERDCTNGPLHVRIDNIYDPPPGETGDWAVAQNEPWMQLQTAMPGFTIAPATFADRIPEWTNWQANEMAEAALALRDLYYRYLCFDASQPDPGRGTWETYMAAGPDVIDAPTHTVVGSKTIDYGDSGDRTQCLNPELFDIALQLEARLLALFDA